MTQKGDIIIEGELLSQIRKTEIFETFHNMGWKMRDLNYEQFSESESCI